MASGAVGRTRGKQHKREAAKPLLKQIMDAFSQLQAVHFRHIHVEQCKVDTRHPLEMEQGLMGGRHNGDVQTPSLSVTGEDTTIGLVVVDYQQMLAFERGVLVGFGPLARLRHRLQTHREGERGSMAMSLTAGDDVPLHLFGQRLADGQAQTCSAESSGGRLIGLAERLEQSTEVTTGHADPRIDHLKLYGQPFRIMAIHYALCPHLHLTSLGELDGIANQIENHLTDTGGITQHQVIRHVRFVIDEFEILLGGSRSQQLKRRHETVVQVDRGPLQHQFASIDLGQVENVVDDDQQRLTAGADGANKVLLLIVEVSGQQQLGHTDHPVHRSADLVAHIGQKVALGRIGRLSPLHRLA